jgi:glycosyltransferase involved in cell wall biosynthesis
MKILVIVDKFPPFHEGGYELRCKDVLDQLKKRGHKIIVITTRVSLKPPKVQDEEDIFRVLNTQDSSRSIFQHLISDLEDLRCINKIFIDFKPNLIYLWHMINLSRAIYPYLADKEIPVVYDEGGSGLSWLWRHHGSWFSMLELKSKSIKKNFIKYFLAAVVHILSCGLIKRKFKWPHIYAYFNSGSSLDTVLQTNVPLVKSEIIYSGIDLSRFNFKEKTNSNSPIKILLPGRVVPQKGIIDSVSLANELVNKRNTHALFIIVGEQSSTTYAENIYLQIKNYGLIKNIEFLHAQNYNKMNSIYQAADFCYFPSYQKTGLSRVPLEAMASGSLVISYGNEGSDEIIKSGATGYIVSEGDISETADIIISLVENPNLYKKIIKSARQEIEKKYSLEKYVENIEDFLLESIQTYKYG